ncbi:aminopeptidase N [Candidatus Kryptonium thompsonii]|uniref:Aminopeptidase N n=1 Tax=Candidatus Kryptonium thompsonii TaxID=1633631 RepID=A0A0P1MLH0_9BACT|nr:M1 family aminopeptidase [Candidatus Kryptonium thompsoni]CUS78076.1 aminopeptidase N [Candidatus Kryptonium thompsoni]CUS79989.1 aminopeptidase N [Candidatus Kryptonium thompsoni]CUS83206.1 aminopeptidase N [Candidatus Kryptonium thompsoni]CUS83941.1 aminopeptidase N [Candidatus Kryptonium thompsoni]CUS84882.1 aminopeptidase N [Candidatus Kryptonium thompsoni]
MNKFSRFCLWNAILLILIASPLISEGRNEFDVLHYEIFIDLYEGLMQRNGYYNGYVKIKLVLNKSSNEINIHSASGVIQIDSVFLSENKLGYQQNYENLKIIFPSLISQGETLIVAIYFQRRSDLERGFYFYRSDEVSPNLPSDIAYTMSEPSDARYWLPCYDEPWDKAKVDLIIKVRSSYLVASNGLLIRDEINGNERIFHWRSKHPMSTYLIAFAVSEYITFSDWYHKVSNPSDSIEVKYYVWREDSLKAVSAFKNVVDMMKFFSLKFGEYPFEKYGMVAVYPFRYGGMEHQTMTTIHRKWLDGNSEGGIAHELAHQWWGDLVTCETWAEIWLNEGFASYGDALYTEYKYGFEAFKSKLEYWAKAYFWEDSIIRYPIYNPPSGRLFGTAVYYKGAWVLHMLRNLIGDSAFFAVLQEWGRRYAYGTGTTQKFIQVVNDITGEDLSWFFNQWVYEAGYPVLDFSVSFANYDTLFINLRQTQRNAIIFRFPIEFKIQAKNLDTILTFWTYSADTVYIITLNRLSALGDIKVQIDPNGKILKKVLSFPSKEVNLPLPFDFSLHQNYPNPFNSSTTISFEIAGGSKVYLCELKIFDVLGREIRKAFSSELGSGKYNIHFVADEISSGVYFYELRVSDGSKLVYRGFKKMVLIK